MGAADLVPGVSGGTVAFITGIYNRLLNAIAAIDKDFIKLILKKDFKGALDKIDFNFLFSLGFGVIFAILSLSRILHYCLKVYPIYLWSFFFGLVLSSIFFLIFQSKRMINPLTIISFILGGLIGYGIINLVPSHVEPTLFVIFIAGMVAISAMILPGISGSFLLLIMGLYEVVTSALKNPFNSDNFLLISVFSIGCLINLIFFSKLLKILFEKFESQLIFLLTGFMLGALPKLWPWRVVTKSVVVREKIHVLSEKLILPDVSSELVISVVLMFLGLMIIAMFGQKGRQKSVN